MKITIILNDPPYGMEITYNGLRLAISLSNAEGNELRVFLMADSASACKSGQVTPNGYYNIERMLKALIAKSIPVGVCGSCMDARGLKADELIPGSHRGSMEELTDWTVWADKVLVF